MALLDLVTTKSEPKSGRIMIYGEPGVGKTSMAVNARDSILVQVEDGADQLECNRLPKVKNWEDLMNQLAMLYKEEHPFRSIVIDSLDAAEAMCLDYIYRTHYIGRTKVNITCLNDLPYGKGSEVFTFTWRRLLKAINVLHEKKGYTVVIIAHSKVGDRIDAVNGDSKFHTVAFQQRRSVEPFRESMDAIIYLAYQVTPKDSGSSSKYDTYTGKRIAYLSPKGACLAKCRYAGMPDEILLPSTPAENWAKLVKGMKLTTEKDDWTPPSSDKE